MEKQTRKILIWLIRVYCRSHRYQANSTFIAVAGARLSSSPLNPNHLYARRPSCIFDGAGALQLKPPIFPRPASHTQERLCDLIEDPLQPDPDSSCAQGAGPSPSIDTFYFLFGSASATRAAFIFYYSTRRPFSARTAWELDRLRVAFSPPSKFAPSFLGSPFRVTVEYLGQN